MKSLEEELKVKMALKLSSEQMSSVEKAQLDNTRKLKEFFLGFAIWFISYGFFSVLQGTFKILVALALAAVDLAISRLGEHLELSFDLILKIRLSSIYLIIMLIAILFY